MSAEIEDPFIGQIPLGQYRITKKIGEGGFGAVYLADQLGVGRKAVVKLLRQGLAGSELFVQRFRREASVLAALDHHHLVRLYNFGELEDGQLFLAMEYGGNRTLADEIRICGRLPEGRALRITSQVCEALHEAHCRGIVHRDLKPANIMLSQKDGQDWVKVVDVGIAKILYSSDEDDSQSRLTGTGMIIGTPAYFSPEQSRGMTLDGRSDVYAMGCVLYEMLTGKLPIEAKSPIDFVRAHCVEKPIPLKSRGVSVSADLESTLVKRILCKDRTTRMSSQELASWALSKSAAAKLKPPKKLSRSLAVLGLGAAAIIAIAVWLGPRIWSDVNVAPASSQRTRSRAAQPEVAAPANAPVEQPKVQEAQPVRPAAVESPPASVTPVDGKPEQVSERTTKNTETIAEAQPKIRQPKAQRSETRAGTGVAMPIAVPAPAPAIEDHWPDRLHKLDQLIQDKKLTEAIRVGEALLKQGPPEDARARIYKSLASAEFNTGDEDQALHYEQLHREFCPTSEQPAADAFIKKLRADLGIE